MRRQTREETEGLGSLRPEGRLQEAEHEVGSAAPQAASLLATLVHSSVWHKQAKLFMLTPVQ